MALPERRPATALRRRRPDRYVEAVPRRARTRDDQTTNGLGAEPPKQAEAAACPIEAPTLVIWGQRRPRPRRKTYASPTTETCRPGPRERMPDGLATGSTNGRGRARSPAATGSSPPPNKPRTDQGLGERRGAAATMGHAGVYRHGISRRAAGTSCRGELDDSGVNTARGPERTGRGFGVVMTRRREALIGTEKLKS